MPFIPHTEQEIAEMLATIGVESIESLFDEIPTALRVGRLERVPEGMKEHAIARLMTERAADYAQPLCFIGAGAYEHHIPSAVWEIATRGEFYSAYTPYQAEASQGTLQLIYEYQSMMAHLTGMDVSNASLYDGASALAEALLMAVRANRKSQSRRILMPRSVHPHYRAVCEALVKNQGIELVAVDFDPERGQTVTDAWPAEAGEYAALVIPQPNFFGVLEEVDALCDRAHQQGALVIAVVNPIAMALLKPPGQWGQRGADIVCGEGQPLGVPLSSGGPYFGFMCCKQDYVRQMPGRIVGRTVDLDGKRGFALTLQAREQHIRRSKATSNICTNQGLMVTGATIYMAMMGGEGLRRVAVASHRNTHRLLEHLTGIAGVERAFSGPVFHEGVVRLTGHRAGAVLDLLAERGILGGYDLGKAYPELGEAVLVCATETKQEMELTRYAETLAAIVSS